jgi:hypothetical protein
MDTSVLSTSCAVAFGTEGGELYILDYKDGRVKVEVEDNTQLMMYASAFIQEQDIRELSHIHLGPN